MSNTLFMNDVVSVQGFPWCKDIPKQIGLSGLTAKILCDHHNNSLSSVDTAGAQGFSVLREMRRLANVREQMKPQVWKVVNYRIYGPDLERWFLKTLINLCCDHDYPIGRDCDVVGRPTEQFVQIAYGLKRFENRAGLYFIVHEGMQVNSTDTVGFSPLIKNHERIEGGLFAFRGLRCLLFLEPEGPPTPLTGIFLEGDDLGDSQLNFHNRQIKVRIGKYTSQILTVDW